MGGNDTVNGNDGDDVIISEESGTNVGLDRLDGGEGSDIYSIINGGGAFDYITDTGIAGTDEIRYSITSGGNGAITLDGNTSGVEKIILGTGTSASAGTSGTEPLSIFAFNVSYGLTLIGNNGNNQLNGSNFSDTIYGGSGNDTLIARNGNDVLVGGIGNDALTGSLGADTFKWELSDKGSAGTSSIDTITDFNLAENDVLDLRDLLIGESIASDNLLNYIDITTNASSTEIRISSSGSFAGGNYSAGNEDARIVLTGYDLYSATGTGSEADLIQNLFDNNKLIVD
jgi:Ca2+-binding RTX toxin-like protein